MAVIGNIRRRSGLLIIIIGFAMLAFIMGDIFGSGGLMGGGQGPQTVGTIAGSDVSQVDLDKRTEYWKSMSKYYGSSNDADARRRAWGDIVFENVMEKQIEDVGLSFTQEEFDEIRFGENVLPEIVNGEIYKGENGQFDPNQVVNLWKGWSEQLPDLWSAEKSRIRRSRLTAKYNALVSKGMISNSLDAADSYMSKNVKMDIQYAMKPYTSIVDSTIAVSDSEIKAYYTAHKDDAQYKQTEARDIEVITFDVKATPEDIALIRGDVEGLIADFKVSENDSVFSTVYSDVKKYNVYSFTRAEMDSIQARDVFAAADGDVVGPYTDGQTFKLYKVIGDDEKIEASVQHILLNAKEEDATIAARADSILKALKRGADFQVLAAKYSQDPGFATNKGLYENFGKGQMVPEFETFAFNEKVGAMGVVKTSFGYHIMEVTDRVNAPQKKIVELMKFIHPSSETLNKAYDEASIFSLDHSDLEKFRAGAAEKGYTIKPTKGLSPGAAVAAGIPDSRAIVRWAYAKTTSVGDVSEPMEFEDKFVIAALTGAREEGAPALEDLRDRVKTEVIKEKKAAMIIADLENFSGLSDAATKWGVTSTSANAISISNPNLPSAGNEPAVVGKAYGSASGSVVGPIKGNIGVYVVQVDSKTEIDPASVNLESEATTLKNSMRGSVSSQLINAINKAEGVKNNMDRIY